MMEFPPVPIHLASKTQKRNMQRVQNRTLRWATGDRATPIDILHERHKLEPINKRIERQARNIWTKIEAIDEDPYNELRDVRVRRHHPWWPRSMRGLENEEEPIYKTHG